MTVTKHPHHFPALPAAAELAVVAIGVSQALQLGWGVRGALTLSLIAAFGVILLLVFRTSKGGRNAAMVVLLGLNTLIGVAVMFVGANPASGVGLFFILCSFPATNLNAAGMVVCEMILCALIVLGFVVNPIPGWIFYLLPIVTVFFGMIGFGLTLRQLKTARDESRRLFAELSQAQGRLREIAVLEERERLAREMHDSVGHRLTVAAVHLEGAARLAKRNPAKAGHMLEVSRDEVREGLAELRQAVSALRGQDDDSLPVADVLRRLAFAFERASGSRVTVEVDKGLVEPDAERRLVIVRTAQEALTNVQKHAAATRVSFALAMEDGHYTLVCRDNGRGMHTRTGAPPADSGFGLGNLRQRAAAFGGRVELAGRDEGGAELRLELPRA